MTNEEKVVEYLDNANFFFLTTVDEKKPKCRPFGFKIIFEGKIYFGVGTFKECYKQMQANPNVEICASNGKDFLRYYGRAVFVENDELQKQAFALAPYLEKLYSKESGRKLAMFYLADATAEFRDLFSVKKALQM